jgi:wyosine [tRNA(Phe)-imidazoG37] synthetase (radical SAM superfamily)
LGRSLGINLLPADYKLCSFNCLYCQYGWTKSVTLMPGDRLKDLPTPDAVATALENALAEFSRRDKAIDAISICGNGEPTLYPALGAVIAKIKKLRDRYQPDARTAILSNSSTIGDPAVRVALELLDLKI